VSPRDCGPRWEFAAVSLGRAVRNGWFLDGRALNWLCPFYSLLDLAFVGANQPGDSGISAQPTWWATLLEAKYTPGAKTDQYPARNGQGSSPWFAPGSRLVAAGSIHENHGILSTHDERTSMNVAICDVA